MLWPIGGFNDCTVPNGTFLQEFLIALGGPLMQIPLFFLWVLVLGLAGDDGVGTYSSGSVEDVEGGGGSAFFAQLAKKSLDINLMVFGLNMFIPAYPMDAASMVAAICGYFGLSITSTAWALVIIGGILGGGCTAIGIIYLLKGDGPGVFLLMMGLYVLYTSWEMYKTIQGGSVHNHPIFKPDCYKNITSRQTNLSGADNPQPPRRRGRPTNDIETGTPPAKKPGRKPGGSAPPKGKATKQAPKDGSAPKTATKKKDTPKKGSAGKAPKKASTGTSETPKKKAATKKSKGQGKS
eukprot:Nitzschia sp. Nitz4//scaffold188_size43225//26266//27147//NITZ4_007347-RA/size43225-processed-gene-0.31-mRNA-1//-1//CDS//3329539850//861//frame0